MMQNLVARLILDYLLIYHNVITCSGQLDMSCNNILDVSRIYFCGKLGRGANWIGQGNSFDISCTDNIKMITADDASMGFFHGSNLELQVDDSHVSISGGSIDTPGLNFLDNEDTGIYRIAPDHIGISTGGIKTVDISSMVTEIIGNNTPSTGTPPTSDVLEILLSKNSALTADNGPSIQYEMEGLGFAAKKRLNQIQCICTYTSNWGGVPVEGVLWSLLCSVTIEDISTVLIHLLIFLYGQVLFYIYTVSSLSKKFKAWSIYTSSRYRNMRIIYL